MHRSINLPTKNMSDLFFSNLKTMAEECDERGLTSTVCGDLDAKTAVYGIFHCVRGSNETVTFTYTINTLSTQIKRKLQSEIPKVHILPGIQKSTSCGTEEMFDYLITSAVQEMKSHGVDLLPFLSHGRF